MIEKHAEAIDRRKAHSDKVAELTRVHLISANQIEHGLAQVKPERMKKLRYGEHENKVVTPFVYKPKMQSLPFAKPLPPIEIKKAPVLTIMPAMEKPLVRPPQSIELEIEIEIEPEPDYASMISGDAKIDQSEIVFAAPDNLPLNSQFILNTLTETAQDNADIVYPEYFDIESLPPVKPVVETIETTELSSGLNVESLLSELEQITIESHDLDTDLEHTMLDIFISERLADPEFIKPKKILELIVAYGVAELLKIHLDEADHGVAKETTSNVEVLVRNIERLHYLYSEQRADGDEALMIEQIIAQDYALLLERIGQYYDKSTISRFMEWLYESYPRVIKGNDLITSDAFDEGMHELLHQESDTLTGKFTLLKDAFLSRLGRTAIQSAA